MFIDEEEKPKKLDWTPRKLDDMSVAAMDKYKEELKAEIARVDVEIGKRGGAKSAAEALFKK